MLIREFKLKPTKKQQEIINRTLWQHISVYNTTLTKLFIALTTGKILSYFDLCYLFIGQGTKAGLNQQTMMRTTEVAQMAFMRWLKKDASGKRHGRPRRKSKRNPVRTLIFDMSCRINPPKLRHIGIPGIGKVRCSKDDKFPAGKIKGGKLIKRASGFYFQFVIDSVSKFPVKENTPDIGIDPGFKTLLTLSDGTSYENPRELRKSEERLAQAQRGRNKKLTAKIQEKIARVKKDRNHRVSRKIVENYSHIYVSKDSFKGLQAKFGKSVSEACLGSLLGMIAYKAQNCGRQFTWVNSKNTTRGCSVCGGLHGPTGLGDLGVREWVCSGCGAQHERDVNAARNILLSGRGTPSSEKINLDRA